MAQTLLPPLAKLTQPRLHKVLRRERLFARLDESREYAAATCVIGPPGAGKTTLVASWLDARAIPGIWYQVDAGDSDLATFFHYLARAAAGRGRKGQRALPLFTPEFAPDPSGFARRFFRLLFERLQPGSVLVLDNYQEVTSSSVFHHVIVDAVDEVPPGMQLVAISRRDPPNCYVRLLANRRVARIDWEDLRLTRDEALAIALSRGRNRTQEMDLLYARCEGWAAGLTLMLERSSNGGQAGQTGVEPTREAVFDYFAAEIFDVLPASTREVLLRAALFPAMTAQLAQAISGIEGAGEVLEALHRRRLFTDQRSGAQTYYQFHPLFREFLLRRLRAALTQADHRALLCMAADLLEQTGEEPEAAIPLYIEAGDVTAAGRSIQALAPALMGQGRWQTLAQWIESLPAPFVAAHAWLLYWQGMAHLQRDIPYARDLLVASSSGFEKQSDGVGQMLAAAAIIRTYHFEYNTFEPMDPWVEAIDALLAEQPQFPSPATELAVYSAILLAITYRLPAHRLRLPAVKRVTQLLGAGLDPNQKVAGAIPLLIYYTLAHEFDAGLPLVAAITPVADAETVSALNRVYWWLFVGYFWHRVGDRHSAEAALARSAHIAHENGLRQTHFISGCFRAYHHSSWGDVRSAAAAIEGLEGMLDDRKPMLAAQYHNAGCFIETWRGNAAEGERHARLAVAAATRLGAPFFCVAWQSQTSAALAMNGAYDLCEAWLEAAWRESEGSFLESYRPMILATRVFLELRRERRELARELLRQLVALAPDARALSYIRGVAGVRETFLCECLSAGLAVPLVQSLIRSWEVRSPQPDLPHWPWRVRVYTLGAFRIEVDGQPLIFSRKTPRKPIALLKAIVALGGRAVPERRLIDALWNDEEGDSAADALAVGLHRLRKLLGHADILTFQDGVVSLDAGQCWTDAWSLSHRLTAVQGHTPPAPAEVDAVCQLYRGAFLEQDLEAPWAVPLRERLRAAFLRFLLQAGRAYEASGRHEAAADLYRRGIEIDELAEELYLGHMRCLDALGRRAEALTTFRRLRQALSVSLGIAPSPAIHRLFREIQQKAQSVSDR
jgi:LuxR family transcriptional regulator, maltose regulon positive regulatory protein